MHRQLLLATLLAPLLFACTGPTGPTGPVGPTGPTGPRGAAGADGTDGADATCAGVAAPAITGVDVAPGPYLVGRGYAVTVTATGGGALSYVHVGDGATFSGAGEAQTLTPAAAGAAFNFAVIVSNGCGVAMAAYGLDEVIAAKALWVTAAQRDGGLGATAAEAMAAADQLCATDANAPAGVAAVKAVLASSVRAPGLDWALAPATAYVRTDGTPIGTTTAGAVFALPDALTGLTNPITAAAEQVFTGLTPAWAVGDTCGDWAAAVGTAAIGHTDQAGTDAFAFGLAFCANPAKLLCAEQ